MELTKDIVILLMVITGEELIYNLILLYFCAMIP